MSLYSVNFRASKSVESTAPNVPVAQSRRYRTAGKRILDVMLVVGTASFTIPVILILAVAVLATGQMPFYIQDRIGLNGETFKIWKLQTMLPNAQERLETYLADNPKARIEWDSKQKLANDPRITAFGNFLRKSSLDELPQLFNVLNGTMSLIGPRPMMLDQEEQYTRSGGSAYFRLRPGMSGLWQVSDRSDGDFIGRVKFDELYDKNLSLKLDVGILVQTVGVVLRGTGV